eukprot:Colp12_sorted_trinity150504_noHs@6901
MVGHGPGHESDCNSHGHEEEYDVHMHVAAVFILIGVSLAGVMLPLLGKLSPHLRLSPNMVLYGRSFGTGVVLATAFVHMLPPAFFALTSPCLSEVWNSEYTAFAGLFALVAAFVIQLIEYIATAKIESLSKETPKLTQTKIEVEVETVETDDTFEVQTASPTDPISKATHSTYGSIPSDCTRVVLSPDEPKSSRGNSFTSNSNSKGPHAHSHDDGHGHSHSLQGLGLDNDTKRRRILLIILEFGIAFHSIIIGMSLGVVTGSEFRNLLIALSFHQFFEGFALGASILHAGFSTFSKCLTMALGYAMSTSLGVVIGIGVHETFDENSTQSLLTEGIFESVSAGVLIYTGLVELLAQQFTHSKHFRGQARSTQILGFASLYLGAAVMGFLGRYA